MFLSYETFLIKKRFQIFDVEKFTKDYHKLQNVVRLLNVT